MSDLVDAAIERTPPQLRHLVRLLVFTVCDTFDDRVPGLRDGLASWAPRERWSALGAYAREDDACRHAP